MSNCCLKLSKKAQIVKMNQADNFFSQMKKGILVQLFGSSGHKRYCSFFVTLKLVAP